MFDGFSLVPMLLFVLAVVVVFAGLITSRHRR